MSDPTTFDPARTWYFGTTADPDKWDQCPAPSPGCPLDLAAKTMDPGDIYEDEHGRRWRYELPE